jgi:mRNA interferase RelE/StbE
MPNYEIVLASSAEKEYCRLPKDIQNRVTKVIDSLSGNPRPYGIVKLKGKEDIYRIRVGDYRIVYGIDDKKRLVDIIYIRHRREVYR